MFGWHREGQHPALPGRLRTSPLKRAILTGNERWGRDLPDREVGGSRVFQAEEITCVKAQGDIIRFVFEELLGPG